MALTDNLISYWKFDESSGNASDSVDSNTLTNANSTAFAAGKINNGANLVASSSNYFSISDASQSGLDITGDFSFSFWTYPSSQPSSGAQRILFGKFLSAGNQRSYSLRYKNNGGTLQLILLVCSDGTTSEDYTWNVTLSNSTWYHIACYWDASASTAELFINNSTQGTQVGAQTSIYNGTADFVVGQTANLGAGEYWDGIIDEFGIWNKLLTTTEITTLYNNGVGLQYPFLESEMFLFF